MVAWNISKTTFGIGVLGLGAVFFIAFAGFSPVRTKDQKNIPLNTVFQPPQQFVLETLYNDSKTECRDLLCFNNFFKDITNQYGPQASISLLSLFEDRGRIGHAIDDHQIAHEIGRKTAERFGVNPEAFILCPTSFNYGCQHGFFEYVLGKTQTTKEAATLICEKTSSDQPLKFNFYCYHGVGHGVLMAQAYDLRGALSACNTLPEGVPQEGCWQGVFMENANAGMRHEAREGVFSDTDPLAPCNTLEVKYQHECFINHAGPLMRFFGNDIGKASHACLKAPDDFKKACLESIGLMVSNPSWQVSLASGITGKGFEETAWALCKKFPEGHWDACVIGAVDNILNFDQLNIERAKTFCQLVDSNEHVACYETIGLNLARQSIDKNLIRERCEIFKGEFRTACFRGAGLL